MELNRRRDWLRTISHQIIAPLTGVVGHAENLSDRVKIIIPEHEQSRVRNMLDSILETSQWAARLTRNLAWIADPEKLGSRLPEDELEIIDKVAKYMIDCARWVQGAARKRGLRKVEVVEETFTSMNGRLRVKSDFFQQALFNLLDNAVKYSDTGMDIFIVGAATNGHGEIKVINTGLRLLPEHAERIFDTEFRAPDAYRRYRTGTGIGLPIARNIIKMHGGVLTAQPSEQTPDGWCSPAAAPARCSGTLWAPRPLS